MDEIVDGAGRPGTDAEQVHAQLAFPDTLPDGFKRRAENHSGSPESCFQVEAISRGRGGSGGPHRHGKW
jgi:hypothetical protein